MTETSAMPSTFTISVTQDDIDNGKAGSRVDCPVALAACRVFNRTIRVGLTVLYIVDDANWHNLAATRARELAVAHYHLPDAAIDFINRFDAGNDVAPFEFALSDADRHDAL